MPHLTKLQEKYQKDGLVVVGVSTDSPKSVAKVKPYVTEWGDKMGYTVAIDKDGATSKAYMDAFEVRGIPHAFVVDQQGKIAWHGHPLDKFDEVVDQVAAGKFDLEAAKKLMAEREKEREEAQRLSKYAREYFQLVESTGNEAEAAALGKKIIDEGRKNASLMNGFAWEILTGEGIVARDLKLALTAAAAANEASGGNDPAILDTFALALFENGHKKEAVAVQTKAIEFAREKNSGEAMIAEFEERLERFKKESE